MVTYVYDFAQGNRDQRDLPPAVEIVVFVWVAITQVVVVYWLIGAVRRLER